MSADSIFIQGLVDTASAESHRRDIRITRRPQCVVPPGEYLLDQPIVVDAPISLIMDGVSLVLEPGAVNGVEFHPGAQWASLRGATIVGRLHLELAGDPVQAGNTGVGVHIAAHGVHVEDVICREVGTGFFIEGRSAAINANGWKLTQCEAFAVRKGLHLIGGDTNGGLADGFVVNGAREEGILDESFLGNTYVGTLLHTTYLEAYKCTVGANYSTFVGSYLELDCGIGLPTGVKESVKSQHNVTFVGGGMVPYADLGSRVGLNASRLIFGDQGPSGHTQVTIPHAAVDGTLTHTLTHNDGTVERWDLRRVAPLNRWGVVTDASGVQSPISWQDVKSSARGELRLETSAASPQGFKPASEQEVADLEARVAALESQP